MHPFNSADTVEHSCSTDYERYCYSKSMKQIKGVFGSFLSCLFHLINFVANEWFCPFFLLCFSY